MLPKILIRDMQGFCANMILQRPTGQGDNVKRFLLLIMVLAGIIGIAGNAQALDACYTGSWFDPLTDDGRGIDIQVLDETFVVGYFYTWYGTEREMYVLNGSPTEDGNVPMIGYQSLFGSTAFAGQASIDIVDNNTLIFSHSWAHDHRNVDNTMRWCFTACDGVYEFQRLTMPVPCEP